MKNIVTQIDKSEMFTHLIGKIHRVDIDRYIRDELPYDEKFNANMTLAFKHCLEFISNHLGTLKELKLLVSSVNSFTGEDLTDGVDSIIMCKANTMGSCPVVDKYVAYMQDNCPFMYQPAHLHLLNLITRNDLDKAVAAYRGDNNE